MFTCPEKVQPFIAWTWWTGIHRRHGYGWLTIIPHLLCLLAKTAHQDPHTPFTNFWFYLRFEGRPKNQITSPGRLLTSCLTRWHLLPSNSWDVGCTDVACWGVNTTGGACGNVEPLCWGGDVCKPAGKAEWSRDQYLGFKWIHQVGTMVPPCPRWQHAATCGHRPDPSSGISQPICSHVLPSQCAARRPSLRMPASAHSSVPRVAASSRE